MSSSFPHVNLASSFCLAVGKLGVALLHAFFHDNIDQEKMECHVCEKIPPQNADGGSLDATLRHATQLTHQNCGDNLKLGL